MATLPKPIAKPEEQSQETAAAEIAKLLEDHFDEMGWSENERDARVAASSARITSAVQHAKH